MRRQRMLTPGETVTVAVSGGPDSVALLSVFAALRPSWNLRLLAVHFDHGLRGAESKKDAEFVQDLCHRLGVDVAIKNLDLQKTLIRQQGLSLQAYAREARYQALCHVADDVAATKIATGHTADDQAETVLMWMIRGSGTGGLGGIHPVRRPHVIRPLLGTSREEILDYLASRELAYRVDSSNLTSLYLRNKIRHELIPILKEFNPNLINVLSRQADIVREDHRYLDQLAANAFEACKRQASSDLLILNRTALLTWPLAIRRRVLRFAIHALACMSQMPRFDAVETILSEIIDGQSGSGVVLHGMRISREYDNIRFHVHLERSAAPALTRWSGVRQTVGIPSHTNWPLTGQTFELSMETPCRENRTMSPQQARLDAATFSRPLILRTWQPGDRFCPMGLGGKRKKLQDFFSDIKLERSKRENVPLLVAPEGILWVGGYRVDHRFRVTESTKEIVHASLRTELW